MNGHMTKHTFRVKIFVINFVWRPPWQFFIFLYKISFYFFLVLCYALMYECVCCVCVCPSVHLSGTFVCVHRVLKVLSRNGIINGNSHQLIAQFAQVMFTGIACESRGARERERVWNISIYINNTVRVG